MIIATAGHVDHGKTSLVHALTGIDTDRLKEEKQRGLTIDLGFAYTDAETGERLGFIDVPGHIRFINNMLAGVSAIDFALLVIAADDGVMPQTREHLDVLQLLGISTGIIALTKIDRCDETRVNEASDEIRRLTENTFLADAEIFPVSVISGDGLETLKMALDIAAEEVERRATAGHFRLAIDRRFSVHGSGIVVTGSVFAGQTTVGENLVLMPGAIPVRVRGLHTQNQEADEAEAGDRCAVNLTGTKLDIEDIHRGNWLTDNPGESTLRADINLTILGSEARALSHWTPVHVHTAANHVTGRVAVLENNRIEPGESGLAQIVLDEAINLCSGDRLVIRDQAALRTLGGGVVLDPWSPRRGRAKPERLEKLRLINPTSPSKSLASQLEQSSIGVDLERFAASFNLRADELETLLVDIESIKLDDHRVISAVHVAQAIKKLVEHLDDWHSQHSSKPGLPRNQVAGLVKQWPVVMLEHVLKQLMASGELEQQGNLYKRPGQGVQLNAREQATLEKAIPLIGDDPLKPPVLHDLAKSLDQEPKALEKVLAQAVKADMLVRPVKNRFFLPEAISELKQKIREAADNDGKLTVQQYRDATGIGRNLGIEMLEYFDRQGVTRRIGDQRQIVET